MSNDIKKQPLLFKPFHTPEFKPFSSTIIFIPALILMIFLSFFSYRQINALIESNNLVAHTYQVIQVTNEALYLLNDIVALQRSYLLTGDENFLKDIPDRKNTLTTALERMSVLTRDNPAQNIKVMNFIDLASERFKFLDQLSELRKRNEFDAQKHLQTLKLGGELSEKVTGVGNLIIAIEMTLLNERNTKMLANASFIDHFIISGYIISILCLLLAFTLSTLSLRKHHHAEKSRKEVAVQLRTILESTGDMIAAVDTEAKYFIFNSAYQKEFTRLFGKKIQVGMSITDALKDAGDSKEKLLQTWQASLEGDEKTKTIEFYIDGKRNTYEVTSNSIKNDANQIMGAIHIVRNITQRMKEQNKLREAYEQINIAMHDLKERNAQITHLVEMSDILLACNSTTELGHVVTNYCEKILFASQGCLYIMHPSRNYLESGSCWSEPKNHELIIRPDNCWAIRLGRQHVSGGNENELKCDHIQTVNKNCRYLCLPLMAQNDIFGLLYIELGSRPKEDFSENHRLLIKAFTELTALALANVRLRENLRFQSIRDPLTGLYNRRYLEDFLFKQIHQAERMQKPVAILMLDIDHFKTINDSQGHDAGDIALKEISALLQNDIREGDLASRYGGEEFVVIFYDTSCGNAFNRAETIRKSVANLQIKYGADVVGQMTISIGIAIYPTDAKSPSELISAADKALYEAKNSGRNKVMLFSDCTLSS